MQSKAMVLETYLRVCSVFYAALFSGCPGIVRTDRGTENSTVAFLQPFLRRNGRDRLAGERSFQYGKSASNQVIYCS